VSECQQTAGNLTVLLRTNLFRHDQDVEPMLEWLFDKSD